MGGLYSMCIISQWTCFKISFKKWLSDLFRAFHDLFQTLLMYFRSFWLAWDISQLLWDSSWHVQTLPAINENLLFCLRTFLTWVRSLWICFIPPYMTEKVPNLCKILPDMFKSFPDYMWCSLPGWDASWNVNVSFSLFKTLSDLSDTFPDHLRLFLMTLRPFLSYFTPCLACLTLILTCKIFLLKCLRPVLTE